MNPTSSHAGDDRYRADSAARRETWASISSVGVSGIAAAAAIAWYATDGGEDGLIASAVGAAACLIGAGAATIAPTLASPSQRVMIRAAAGLLLRAGVPLAAILWAKLQHPEWLQSGLVGTVAIVYFAGWATEVAWRILRRTPDASASPSSPERS